MASILKVGSAWRAQVRRKSHKSVSETFPTKAQAQAWARKVEAEMDARRFNDVRGLANITLKELIDWYSEEIGGAHPFGKNKKAVLRSWARDHGDLSLDKLSADYLTTYVRNRRKAGASGVTISIDLTYIGSVLRSARDLRELHLDKGWLTLTVRDNGRRLAPGSHGKAGSFGLVGIEERALILGGTCSVYSEPGGGTTVTVSAPANAVPLSYTLLQGEDERAGLPRSTVA